MYRRCIGTRSDRRDQPVLRGARLNRPLPAVAGIDLFASLDQPERFQEGHIPLHRFAVPLECHREFRNRLRLLANGTDHSYSLGGKHPDQIGGVLERYG